MAQKPYTVLLTYTVDHHKDIALRRFVSDTFIPMLQFTGFSTFNQQTLETRPAPLQLLSFIATSHADIRTLLASRRWTLLEREMQTMISNLTVSVLAGDNTHVSAKRAEAVHALPV